MLIRWVAPVICVTLPAAGGVVESFANDPDAYAKAVGGVTDLFVDFETDRDGNLIRVGLDNIAGDIFSPDVVYSSENSSEVRIITVGSNILNEIGPVDTWSGILRWEYTSIYRATSFLGLELESDAVISFYNDDQLVDSVTVDGDSVPIQFFGFVVDTGFNSVEINGDFFAIDAHASTLVPSPSGFCLLGVAGMLGANRRRRFEVMRGGALGKNL